MRDLTKVLNDYKPNDYYELDAAELMLIGAQDKFTAIVDAFKIGYVLGQRATRAEQKRAKKKEQ